MFYLTQRKPLPLTYRVYEPNKKQRVESTKATATADSKVDPAPGVVPKLKSPQQCVKTNGLLKNGLVNGTSNKETTVHSQPKDIPVNGQTKDVASTNGPLKENRMNTPPKDYIVNASPNKIVSNGPPKNMSNGTPKKYVSNGPPKVGNGPSKKIVANGLSKDHVSSNGVSMSKETVASANVKTNGLSKDLITKPVVMSNGGMLPPADVAKT